MLSGSKLGESNDSIEYFINPIDYKNKLLEAKKAFCLIDLKLESHNGLSFRFYESLYFQKKLITNNKDVVNYDFYNSNNILIEKCAKALCYYVKHLVSCNVPKNRDI